MDTFGLESERMPGSLLVRLIGEFDLAGHDELDEFLSKAHTDGNPDVVVDLRGLTFIDSSGIRALLTANKRAAAVGGTFRLIRGPDNVHRVFQLAGLDGKLAFIGAERTEG